MPAVEACLLWLGQSHRMHAWCACTPPTLMQAHAAVDDAVPWRRLACRYSSAGSAISSQVAGVMRQGSRSSAPQGDKMEVGDG